MGAGFKRGEYCRFFKRCKENGNIGVDRQAFCQRCDAFEPVFFDFDPRVIAASMGIALIEKPAELKRFRVIPDGFKVCANRYCEGRLLPATDQYFTRNAKEPDGRSHYCIECTKNLGYRSRTLNNKVCSVDLSEVSDDDLVAAFAAVGNKKEAFARLLSGIINYCLSRVMR